MTDNEAIETINGLIGIADTAMTEANQDGAEWERGDIVKEAESALAHLTKLAEENAALREQLRLANIDNLNVEAELAEANGMAKVADEQCEAAMREAEKVKATLAEIEYYGESPTMYLAKVEAYTKLEAEHETLKAEMSAGHCLHCGRKSRYKAEVEQSKTSQDGLRALLDAAEELLVIKQKQLEKAEAELVSVKEQFDKFSQGVQRLMCELADKPRGTECNHER